MKRNFYKHLLCIKPLLQPSKPLSGLCTVTVSNTHKHSFLYVTHSNRVQTSDEESTEKYVYQFAVLTHAVNQTVILHCSFRFQCLAKVAMT